MPYKNLIVGISAICMVAFLLNLGYRTGVDHTELKYTQQMVTNRNLLDIANNKVNKLEVEKQNFNAKVIADLASKQVKTEIKYQIKIKEVIRYVKEKPDINVYVPTVWVLKFLNPAISDTEVPEDANISGTIATTPAIRIDRLIEPIVYDMNVCNRCIYIRQALIDEVKNNMKDE